MAFVHAVAFIVIGNLILFTGTIWFGLNFEGSLSTEDAKSGSETEVTTPTDVEGGS
ncbi:hypothetical protein GWG54_15630 [Natronococcus sp. JC468]|uniref:hypothetical protein n=1 Tax=Natronococcus sp. JC468 TaxID=1961921 RepID=UPI001438A02E|nr:hypothetical protein [Natronococcus sp. JC468]NKE37228.1 hypothetical protein [Natronococcus sp. JC468]